MDIADIYDKFDQIGCLTFATIDKDFPQTRIAHLFAHDHDEQYIIDPTKCDVCGDCYTICPASAIEIVIDDPNN